MLHQVFDIDAFGCTGHQHVQFSVIKDSEPGHWYTFAEAIDKGIRLRLDPDIEPMIRHHVYVPKLVLVIHFDIGPIWYQVNLSGLSSHAVLVVDLEVQFKIFKVAIILTEEVQVLVQLKVEVLQFV